MATREQVIRFVIDDDKVRESVQLLASGAQEMRSAAALLSAAHTHWERRRRFEQRLLVGYLVGAFVALAAVIIGVVGS